MQLKYYKELDGVRGLAAIMVMLFHYINGLSYSSSFFQSIKKLTFLGQTGVSLFFVLSGFLITRILIKQKDKSYYFKYFYYRRALRIFPLYFLFLFIYFIITGVLTHSFNLNNIFYYVVYIQNFAMTFQWNISGPEHLWSLAVEEHFYIFWPFIIFLVSSKYLSKFVVAMIILSISVRVFLLQQNLETFYFTFSRLDELSFGCLLALKELRDYTEKKKFKFNKTTYVFFTLSILTAFFVWYLFSGKNNYGLQIFKYTFLGFIYYICIGSIIQLHSKNWLKKIFLSKVLCFSGGISYGLYIYHPLCFLLLNQIIGFHYLIVNFLISFLFTYIVAYLSFNYFEYPFIKLKSKLAN